jgi:hypothetical protein
MIKRDIVETIYEYDNEGKLIRKTVTETHEEEEEKVTTSTWRTYPNLTIPCLDRISTTTPYCETNSTSDMVTTHTMAMNETN